MAWVNAPNTLWCSLLYNGSGEVIIENNLYFEKITGVLTRPIAHNLLVALNNWAQTNLMTLLSSDVTLNDLIATDMTTFTGFTEGVFNPGGFPGSGGPSLPFNAAIRVEFLTGTPGRSFRGRNYVSGIPKSVQTGPHVSADLVSGLQDAYNALIPLAASQGFIWVVCSRHSSGIDRPVAVNTPVLSAFVQDDIIETWRQRAPGRHT